MKKTITILAISFLISCAGYKGTENSFVKPLPTPEEFKTMENATVPAEFTSDSFNWRGGNLTMTVYSEDLYDIVDIHNLSVGDTLLYDGDTILVNKIEENGPEIIVNDGIEEGGANIIANEGGTYRAFQFDDHSLYTKVGETQLQLADDFIIIDCKENPSEPSDTIKTDQKLYIESLKDYKRDFNVLNTTVRTIDGLVVEINRRWIP